MPRRQVQQKSQETKALPWGSWGALGGYGRCEQGRLWCSGALWGPVEEGPEGEAGGREKRVQYIN